MRIVVDTSGWYASAVAADLYHETAKQFLLDHHEFSIVPEVFSEATALLLSRQGKKLAFYSGELMRKVAIEPINPEMTDVAWQLFKNASSQVSYVDCVVAATAKHKQLPVFTFDKHFLSLGIPIVPHTTPIPTVSVPGL